MARTVAGATPGRTNRKFLIVALLFGAVTAALFYAVTARGGGSGSTSTPVAGDTQVVVAKVPIQQRTTITADMLQLKSISTSALVGGAYTSINDAVGKVTKFPIEANQQVVSSAVVDVSKPSTVGALSLVIPAGMRAVSIQASQVSSAGGLILPGDYIDLVWTCCDTRPVAVKTILTNIQVAAVAQSVVNAGPVAAGATTANGQPSTTGNPAAAAPGQPVPDASTMTLLLKPDQVQLVALAEQSGKLRVDLRGFGDQDATTPAITLFPQLIPIDVFKSLPTALQPDFAKQP
ncbi:MAG TPA: Flp pilus assembly protein CpaB [Dehalococcoidia bacterium]|nr:Flp pilus assembly protein CpaB [Dehalococcoidia bacterium]